MTYADVCRGAAELIEEVCAPLSAVKSKVAHLRTLADLLDTVPQSLIEELTIDLWVGLPAFMDSLTAPLSDP